MRSGPSESRIVKSIDIRVLSIQPRSKTPLAMHVIQSIAVTLQWIADILLFKTRTPGLHSMISSRTPPLRREQ